MPERTPPTAPARTKRPAPPKARAKPPAKAPAKPRTRAQIQADAKARTRGATKAQSTARKSTAKASTAKAPAKPRTPADGEATRTAPEGRRVPSERVRKRRMLLKVGFAGLFLVLFLFLFVFPTRTYLQQRNQKNAAEQHLQLLRRQTAMLKNQTKQLKSGAEIEQIARARFGMIRPGETPYAVVPTPTSTQPATSPTAAPGQQP